MPAAYSHNLRECVFGAVEDDASCRCAVSVFKVIISASTLSDRLTIICAAFKSSGRSYLTHSQTPFDLWQRTSCPHYAQIRVVTPTDSACTGGPPASDHSPCDRTGSFRTKEASRLL